MLLAWAVGLLTMAGCAAVPAPFVYYENPAFLPGGNHDVVWDTLVDVVDDYFRIDREERVKRLPTADGEILTVGRIDTFPEVGATYLEPWRGDSASAYERLESTLQTIRRRAEIKLTPQDGGFLLDVAVYKELEDARRPTYATTGSATFRYDNSLQRYTEPVGGQAPNVGWIPQGRDPALEQRIIGQWFARLGAYGRPPVSPQPVIY